MLSSQKSRGLSRVLDELLVLRREQFTGQLRVSSQSQPDWLIYIQTGQILYATGGQHPARRWRRQLVQAAPILRASLSDQQLPKLVAKVTEDKMQQDGFLCWEYTLLHIFLTAKQLTDDQAHQVIAAILGEIFIDILQARDLTCKFFPGETIAEPITLFDAQKFAQQQRAEWQAWLRTNLNDSPVNLADAPEMTETAATNLASLAQVLDGANSFWDLAAKMQRTPLEVVLALQPHLRSGAIRVKSCADLPLQVAEVSEVQTNHTQPLIACVDDSPALCQSLEQTLTTAGYRFLGITDAMRAIPKLLAKKPNLIFLDLRMPVTNGYEICSQLRRLSAFKDTPIIILTGNDGIVDRSRARLVGATDYLNKNVSQEQLLATLQQYVGSAQDVGSAQAEPVCC